MAKLNDFPKLLEMTKDELMEIIIYIREEILLNVDDVEDALIDIAYILEVDF